MLSFLEPKDLCRAAQTCRYWRILAEDNLLWREKCREETIDEQLVFGNRLRTRNRTVSGSSNSTSIAANSSPWKSLYLRQKQIEHNWRSGTLKMPKV